jgi:peptidoglycan/LPS O-acetylase OafA/YrhL
MVREYLSIQYLRGLAALLVVIYHLEAPLQRLGYKGPWLIGLSGGVDVFFVISGFIMWVTTRNRSNSPRLFLVKRFIRIVPLYWLATAFMAVVLLIAPSLLQSSRFDPMHVATSFAFVPYPHPVKGSLEPLVFPGWTLNYEMFFYLVFAACLLLPIRVRFITTIAVFAALVTAGFVVPHDQLTLFSFYTSNILLDFVYGILLAEAASHDRFLPIGAATASVAIGFIGLLVLPNLGLAPRTVSYGLPALVIVAGVVSIECTGKMREWKFAHELGNASYSLYLTQLFSMAAFFTIWRKFATSSGVTSLTVFSILDVSVAVATGIICHILVEKPITTFLNKKTRTIKKRQLSPATT